MPNSRRDFLSKKYDELFEKADAVVKKHDPCKISNGTCSAGRKASNGLCCHDCPHIGPTGCTTKSLGCKIWLCYFDNFSCPNCKVADPYWADMIPILKEAEKYKLSLPRSGKEVTISSAMVGRHRGCRGNWNEAGPMYPIRHDPAYRDRSYMTFIEEAT